MRSRDVAALAPPISAGVSAAILQGIVGGSAGGGAGGGGLLAWITGSGAKAALGSQAAKSLLTAALVTASAGAIGVVSALQTPQGGREAVGPPREVRDVSAPPDAMTLRTIATSAPTASRPAPASKRTRRGAHEHGVSSTAPAARLESVDGGTVSHHGAAPGAAAPTGTAIVTAPAAPDTPTAPSLPQLAPTSLGTPVPVPALPATPTIAPPMLDFVSPTTLPTTLP